MATPNTHSFFKAIAFLSGWSSVLVFAFLLLSYSCTTKSIENYEDSAFMGKGFKRIYGQQLDPYFYVHLRGSIGGDAVSIDLAKTGDSLTGQGLYLDSKVSFGLFGKLDSVGIELLKNDSVSFKVWVFEDSVGSLVLHSLPEAETQVDLVENYAESEPLSFLQISKFFSNEKNGSVEVALNYLRPQKEDLSFICDSLFSDGKFKQKGQNAMEAEANEFLNTFKELCDPKKGEEAMASCNWSLMKDCSVTLNDFGILSLAIDQYDYSGGAHPNSSTSFLVFDLKKRKRILLTDLFDNSAMPELRGLINYQIRDEMNINASESLESLGFFVSTLEPTDNFYLSADGIGFVYNSYDIAPYSMGSFHITLPYVKFAHLLKSGSSIAVLAGGEL